MTHATARTVARRLREEAEHAERERMLLEKTRPAREAAEAERRQRAEEHRRLALEPLSDRLAAVVFDYPEHAEGRVMVRDQLAQRLHAMLLASDLWATRASRRQPDLKTKVVQSPLYPCG